jgi:crossover junction endodeoxyribonuclease RusA
MTKTFELLVYGPPKGQPRPRAFVRRFGGQVSARVYDPGTAEHWKSQIAQAAQAAGATGAMVEGPIRLTLVCHFKRPRSHYRTGKNAHLLRDCSPRYYHTGKPDADNLIKAVKDTLTHIGVWHDDSQVAVEHVVKVWEDTDFSAISISQLPDEPS